MDKLSDVVTPVTDWESFFGKITGSVSEIFPVLAEQFKTSATAVDVNPEVYPFDYIFIKAMEKIAKDSGDISELDKSLFQTIFEMVSISARGGFMFVKDLITKLNFGELLSAYGVDMAGVSQSFKGGSAGVLIPYITDSDAAECASSFPAEFFNPGGDRLSPPKPIRVLLKSHASRRSGILIISLPRLKNNSKLIFSQEVLIVPDNAHIQFFEGKLHVDPWYVGKDLPFTNDAATPIFVDFTSKTDNPIRIRADGELYVPMPVSLTKGIHIVGSPVSEKNKEAEETASAEDKVLIEAAKSSQSPIVEYPYFWKGYNSAPKKPTKNQSKHEYTVFYNDRDTAVTTTIEFLIGLDRYKGHGEQTFSKYLEFFDQTVDSSNTTVPMDIFTNDQNLTALTKLTDIIIGSNMELLELNTQQTMQIKNSNTIKKMTYALPTIVLMHMSINPAWWVFLETIIELSANKIPKPSLVAACKILPIADQLSLSTPKGVSKFKITMIPGLIRAGGVHWVKMDKTARLYVCKLLKISEKLKTNVSAKFITERCRFGFTKSIMSEPDGLVSLIYSAADRPSATINMLPDNQTLSNLLTVPAQKPEKQTRKRKIKDSDGEAAGGRIRSKKKILKSDCDAESDKIKNLLSIISNLEEEKNRLLGRSAHVDSSIPTDLPAGTVVVMPEAPEESDVEDIPLAATPMGLCTTQHDVSDSEPESDDENLMLCDENDTASGNEDGYSVYM